MLRRILVATDGSESSRRAVQVASEIAVRFEAGLVLVNVAVTQPSREELGGIARFVSEMGPQPFGMLHADELMQRLTAERGTGPNRARGDALRELGEHLLKDAAAAARTAGVPAPERRVLEGGPAEAIIDSANAERADLVVLGSEGLGGMRRLLGSVSEKVTRHCPVSCLTVR